MYVVEYKGMCNCLLNVNNGGGVVVRGIPP